MKKRKQLTVWLHKAMSFIVMLHLAFAWVQTIQIGSAGFGLEVRAAHADALDTSSLSGSDPFAKIGTKAKSTLTSITNIAVPILALCIAGLAIAMFTGRLDKKVAITMIAGGFIIGSSLSIANWIIS